MRLPISRRIPFLGILLAFSIMLGYVEGLIPVIIPVPGIKLGLANLPVVICLYLFSPLEALLLTIIKALLNGFLFGSGSTIIYSLAGAVLSLFGMFLFKKLRGIHIPVVSATGGIFHNIGQLLVAGFILRSEFVWFYFPILALSGLLTGGLLGVLCGLILPKIKRFLYKGEY